MSDIERRALLENDRRAYEERWMAFVARHGGGASLRVPPPAGRHTTPLLRTTAQTQEAGQPGGKPRRVPVLRLLFLDGHGRLVLTVRMRWLANVRWRWKCWLRGWRYPEGRR